MLWTKTRTHAATPCIEEVYNVIVDLRYLVREFLNMARCTPKHGIDIVMSVFTFKITQTEIMHTNIQRVFEKKKFF